MRSGKPQQGNIRGRTTITRSSAGIPGRKVALAAAVTMALLAAFAAVAPAADGATLGAVSAASNQSNTWSSVAITFQPTTAWPADGRLQVSFPPAYVVSQTSASVGVTGCNGGFTRSIAGNVVTVTRTGAGTPCTALATVTLGNIRQPLAGSYSIGLATQTSTGGALDTATATHTVNFGVAPTVASTLSNVAITFKPLTSWPANGRLQVTFPAAYDLSATSTIVSATGCSGAFTRVIAGSVITITRDGTGTACTSFVTLTLSSIRQPTAGPYSITLTTQTSAGATLDTATATHTVNWGVAAAQANDLASVAIRFEPVTVWPADGRLQVTFPVTYELSGTSAAVAVAGCNGGFTRAIAANVITVTRDGTGTTCTSFATVTLGNIRQPGAGSYTIGLATQNSGGGAIDAGTAVHAVNVGTLGGVDILADSTVGGATTTYTFEFTTTHGWPSNGLFQASFPSGFTVAPTSATMSTGCGGQLSASHNGQTVTLARSGGSNCVNGQTVRLSFNGVRNPSTVGVTPGINFQTATSLVRAIDAGSDTVTIGSASLTALSAIPAVNTAGATTSYTVGFTATNPIPSGGKVTFTWDAAFDLGSLGSAVTVTGCTGSAPTRTFSGQTVTLTFPAGTPPSTACNAGPLTFAFTGIKSPSRAGSFGIDICTRTSAADTSVACSPSSQPANTIDNGRATATIVPAALTQTTVTASNPEASKTAITYTIQFTLANDWPALGDFSATFPPGFVVSGAAAGASSPACAALAPAPNPAAAPTGQTVVLARNTAAPTCPDGTAVSIQITGIKNGPVSGATAPITFRTRFPTVPNQADIDQGSGTVTLTPGTMLAQSVATTPASTKVREVAQYQFSFTTAGGWPADAQLKLVFPSSFDLSGVATSAIMTQGTCSAGNLPVARTGSILQIARSGGTTCPAGTPVTIAIDGVRNPMVSGVQTFPAGAIQTLSATGAIMDRTTVAFTSPAIDPNTITAAAIVPLETQAGATTSYTITFTSITGIPGDGKILVTFPVIPAGGFPQPLGTALTVTGKTGCTSGTFTATSSASTVSPPVLTISRSGSECPPGEVSFTVSGIRSPAVTGDYSFGTNWIQVTGSGGASQVIERGSPAATVTLTPRPLTNTGLLAINSLQASGLTDYQFSFRLVNPVPAGGRITAIFPAAYTMPATPTASISGACAGVGVASVSTVGGLHRITTTSPVACPGGTDVVVRFGGADIANKIGNPPFSGPSGTIAFCTQLVDATGDCNQAKTIDNASGAVTLTPGSFSLISVTPVDTTLGATTNYEFRFRPANPWPADGRLVLTAPNGIDLASLSPTVSGLSTGCNSGLFTASRVGQVLTITRSGGSPCTVPAGLTDTYSVTLHNVRNPTAPGAQTFTWRTQLANGQAIDVTPTPAAAGQTPAFTAAVLTDIAVTPGSNVAGAQTSYAFAFTLVNSWPADGRAKFTFPAGYDLAGIGSTATVTGCTGAFAVTKAGLEATVARSGGSVCAAGTAVTMTLTGVRNAAGSGDASFPSNAVRTTLSSAAGGATIDQGSATAIAVTLVPGAASGVSIAASNAGTGAASVYTFKLTITNPWPAAGKFRVTLPAGYALGTPTATLSTTSGCTAGNLANAGSAGNIIVLVRSGGTQCPAGTQVEIVVGTGITNPSAAGSYFVDFATQGTGTTGDIENAGATVPIGAITAAIVQAQDATPNALTRYTFVVATTTTWPSDGRLSLGFPSSFDQAEKHRVVATTRTLGSTTMTSAGLFVASDVGRGVVGTGIPAGTTIVGLTDSSTAALSAAATAAASASNVALGPGVIQLSGCNGALALDGVSTAAGMAYVVALKRTGAGVVPCAPGSLTVTIDGIKNPSNRGRFPGFNVRLMSQANEVLEEHTGSVHLSANAAEISSPTVSFAGVAPGTNITLQAIVRDSDGKPVGGFAVSWSLTGAGQLLNPTSITDDSGIAVAVVQVASNEATVQASAPSLQGSPLTFTINPKGVAPGGRIVGSVVATAPVRVASGTAFTAFAFANTVEAGGAGARIDNVTQQSTFRMTPDGSCNGNVCTATTSGPHTVIANYVGIEGSATVFIEPGAAAAIAAVASPNANTAAGQGAVLTVLVTDAAGNPVPGVAVTWAVGSGGGSISTATMIFSLDGGSVSRTSATGPDGKATATLTTGETPGANTATASVNGLTGSPVTFTVTTPAPATLTASAASATGSVGAAVPLTVTLRDSAGTAIVGARITWSAAGDGRLAGPQSTTDSNGQAGMTVRSSQGGLTTVTATHAGLTATIAVTVSEAATLRLEVSPSDPTGEVGQAVAFVVKSVTTAGSSTDVTAQAVFSIAPDGVCFQNTCTPASSGDHIVTVQVGALRTTVPMTVAEGGSGTDKPSPAVPLPLLVAALAALVVLKRRRLA